MASQGPNKPRWRRWLKRFLWTGAILCVGLGGFLSWALLTCFAEPPQLPVTPPIREAQVTTDAQGRRSIGSSWFLERPGHSLLYLAGDPFTIGYSNAALTRELLEAQERSLMETVRTLLPGTLSFYSAALLVLVHNRNLPDYVSEEHQQEIFGLSQFGSDPYPQFGHRYHRILNYHAAHDISHWVQDTPGIGCTAFAAVGPRTRDGNLIVGRNFDWESGEHFDVHKVIALYRPTQGHAFLSVVWPGMAGAVTGMNDARLFCSLNGAHTEHMGLGVGRPVSLVVRDVLQYADDIDSAVARIRAAPVFVADSFLLADGKTGRAVVVEKTPASCAVRSMHGDWIVQSNHFETAALAGDQGNVEYMRDGTSVARRERLAELLAQNAGALDVQVAAGILRDRRGPGDAERGPGHRSTLNPMIATHAVVADVTRGILWVSRGRHQLGAFDGYTIDDFGTDEQPTIPADPSLADGSYERLTRYRALLATLEANLVPGQPVAKATRQKLRQAEELNPFAPEVLALRARLLEADGDPDAALARFRGARRAFPPFRCDRDAIDAAIRRLEARPR